MSLISAAVCVVVMSVMSTLETRAVWAMAGRGKLQHSIHFVRELDSWSDNPPTIHLSNRNRSDRIHVHVHVQLMTGIKKPSH